MRYVACKEPRARTQMQRLEETITKSSIIRFRLQTETRSGDLYHDIEIQDRDGGTFRQEDIDLAELAKYIENLPDRCKIRIINYRDVELENFMKFAKSKNFRFIDYYREGLLDGYPAGSQFFSINCTYRESSEEDFKMIVQVAKSTKRINVNFSINLIDFVLILQQFSRLSDMAVKIYFETIFVCNHMRVEGVEFLTLELYKYLAACPFKELILHVPGDLSHGEILQLTEQANNISNGLTLVWLKWVGDGKVTVVDKGGLVVFASSKTSYKTWLRPIKVRISLMRQSLGPYQFVCPDLRLTLVGLLFGF